MSISGWPRKKTANNSAVMQGTGGQKADRKKRKKAATGTVRFPSRDPQSFQNPPLCPTLQLSHIINTTHGTVKAWQQGSIVALVAKQRQQSANSPFRDQGYQVPDRNPGRSAVVDPIALLSAHYTLHATRYYPVYHRLAPAFSRRPLQHARASPL